MFGTYTEKKSERRTLKKTKKTPENTGVWEIQIKIEGGQG
jgi:hypothetical protein